MFEEELIHGAVETNRVFTEHVPSARRCDVESFRWNGPVLGLGLNPLLSVEAIQQLVCQQFCGAAWTVHFPAVVDFMDPGVVVGKLVEEGESASQGTNENGYAERKVRRVDDAVLAFLHPLSHLGKVVVPAGSSNNSIYAPERVPMKVIQRHIRQREVDAHFRAVQIVRVRCTEQRALDIKPRDNLVAFLHSDGFDGLAHPAGSYQSEFHFLSAKDGGL